MALTPDDVLNKQFTQTQFRKGYDEREVDDFLDEIVADLRRAAAEEEELRTQLNDCRAGRGLPEIAAGGSSQELASLKAEHSDLQSRFTRANSDVETLTNENQQLKARVAELEDARSAAVQAAESGSRDAAGHQAALDDALSAQRAAEERAAQAEARADEAHREAEQRVAEAKAAAEAAVAEANARAEAAAQRDEVAGPSTSEIPALAGAAGSTGAAGLLALAQRLHDQHVAEGTAQRDELINEGQTRRDELLAEAKSRHEEMITVARERSSGMIHEAQQRKAQILEALVTERTQIEEKITHLRSFEAQYRGRLKEYISGQLADLEAAAMNPEESARDDDSDGSPVESPQG